MCRENANVSLDKLHEIAENGLREQLKQLGFDVSGKVQIYTLLLFVRVCEY